MVSIGSYWLFVSVLGIDALIGNVFSWILAVLFAYVTNRKWVFNSTASSKTDILKEMLSFFAARLATLGIEELLIFIFINLLGLNSMVVKIGAQIVVLVLNYLFSKLIVFRKKHSRTQAEEAQRKVQDP